MDSVQHAEIAITQKSGSINKPTKRSLPRSERYNEKRIPKKPERRGERVNGVGVFAMPKR